MVPFDYINLTLHDPVRNVMRLQLLVAPDDDGTLRPGFELPMDSPSGLAWSSQQPVMVEDLDAEIALSAADRAPPREPGAVLVRRAADDGAATSWRHGIRQCHAQKV